MNGSSPIYNQQERNDRDDDTTHSFSSKTANLSFNSSNINNSDGVAQYNQAHTYPLYQTVAKPTGFTLAPVPELFLEELSPYQPDHRSSTPNSYQTFSSLASPRSSVDSLSPREMNGTSTLLPSSTSIFNRSLSNINEDNTHLQLRSRWRLVPVQNQHNHNTTHIHNHSFEHIAKPSLSSSSSTTSSQNEFSQHDASFEKNVTLEIIRLREKLLQQRKKVADLRSPSRTSTENPEQNTENIHLQCQEQLQNEQNQHKQQLEELQAKYQREIRENKEQRESELEKLRLQFEKQLEQERENWLKSHQETINNNHVHADEHDKQMMSLKEQIKELEQKNQSLTDSWNAREEELRKQYSDECNEYKAAFSERSRKVIEGIEGKIVELQQIIQRQANENSDAKQLKNQLEDQVRDLQHENQQKTERNTQLQEELEKMRSQLKHEKNTLGESAQKVKEENETLRKLQRKAEEDLETTKKQFTHFKNETNEILAKHASEKAALEHHKRRLERGLMELNSRLNQESSKTPQKDRQRIAELELLVQKLHQENQNLKQKVAANGGSVTPPVAKRLMNGDDHNGSDHQNLPDNSSTTPNNHRRDSLNDSMGDLNLEAGDDHDPQPEDEQITNGLATVVKNNPDMDQYISRVRNLMQKKKIRLEILNREVVVRVGGGYQKFEDYVHRKFASRPSDTPREKEELKREREAFIDEHMHSITIYPKDVRKSPEAPVPTKWR